MEDLEVIEKEDGTIEVSLATDSELYKILKSISDKDGVTIEKAFNKVLMEALEYFEMAEVNEKPVP